MLHRRTPQQYQKKNKALNPTFHISPTHKISPLFHSSLLKTKVPHGKAPLAIWHFCYITLSVFFVDGAEGYTIKKYYHHLYMTNKTHIRITLGYITKKEFSIQSQLKKASPHR